MSSVERYLAVAVKSSGTKVPSSLIKRWATRTGPGGEGA